MNQPNANYKVRATYPYPRTTLKAGILLVQHLFATYNRHGWASR